MTVDERDLLGRVVELGLEGRELEAAVRVDGQPADVGALGLAQPLDGVEHGVVLDRRGEHARAARVLVAAGAEDALDREVVGLGAAGGEDHVARAYAERGRDLLARLLHHAPGPTARGVQRGGVAHDA